MQCVHMGRVAEGFLVLVSGFGFVQCHLVMHGMFSGKVEGVSVFIVIGASFCLLSTNSIAVYRFE